MREGVNSTKSVNAPTSKQEKPIVGREKIAESLNVVVQSSEKRKRESVFPQVDTYEQARNKALEVLGDVDWASGKPHLGKFGVAKGKVDGRKWHDGDVVLRLDYDPLKGPHINVTDYRLGKGINGISVAIPFEGTESTVEALLKHLQ